MCFHIFYSNKKLKILRNYSRLSKLLIFSKLSAKEGDPLIQTLLLYIRRDTQSTGQLSGNTNMTIEILIETICVHVDHIICFNENWQLEEIEVNARMIRKTLFLSSSRRVYILVVLLKRGVDWPFEEAIWEHCPSLQGPLAQPSYQCTLLSLYY